MEFSIDILWGALILISFWSVLNSVLKLGVKIKYRMTIEDEDISMVATTITAFIVFILLLIH